MTSRRSRSCCAFGGVGLCGSVCKRGGEGRRFAGAGGCEIGVGGGGEAGAAALDGAPQHGPAAGLRPRTRFAD